MRKLEQRIDIQASEGAVWVVLNDFSGVAQWAPYLRHSRLVGGRHSGVGSYRVMRHYWGFRLEEEVVEWTDGTGYTFDVVVVPFPMKDVRETWALEPGNPHVTVTTSVEYDMRIGMLGSILDRVLVRHLIRREMREGLKGLRRYVESR